MIYYYFIYILIFRVIFKALTVDLRVIYYRQNVTFFIGLVLLEGHGAMVRAWRSADVAACRAVS